MMSQENKSNKLDQLYDGCFTNFSKGYLNYLQNLISNIDTGKLNLFFEIIIDARSKDKKIFFIGNGGSAATASHFANDISIGSKSLVKPIRAISLTDNQAIITAIANDYGYENIFSKQLEVLASPNDILVAITASGDSENIIKALNFAKDLGMETLAITGFDGGLSKKLAANNIHIATKKGEYGPVEDIHMMIAGLIGSYLVRFVKEL